jgi:hypothetical protein
LTQLVPSSDRQIRGNFTTDFKNLVKEILNKEPEARPSAKTLLYDRVMPVRELYRFTNFCFQLLSRAGSRFPLNTAAQQSSDDSEAAAQRSRNVRSVLYSLDISTNQLAPVPALPQRIRVKQVCSVFRPTTND